MNKIAYVGVDYHMKVLSIAVLVDGEKDFYDTIRFKNEDRIIFKYMKKLSKQFDLRICYEASSNGYSFQRKMHALGLHCDVIAPSLIPKKPGDRRKNDYRDAKDLARHYANGSLSIVHPPSEEEESVRSLIRCRLTFKGYEKKVKQQINFFLLARDFRWIKSKWTHQHRLWLSALQLPNAYLQQVLEEYLGHLEYIESRIQCLDEQIEQISQSDLYAPSVKKLRAFRGLGTLGAMLLITEITDFRRFPNPRALMAFLGLIPSEHSSGDKQRGGSIIKAGNYRCRTQLIESVQHSMKKPWISSQMKEALSHVDAHSANIAIKCMKRLYKRYWALVLRGKTRQVALTAVAREFVGFIWAIMQPEISAMAS